MRRMLFVLFMILFTSLVYGQSVDELQRKIGGTERLIAEEEAMYRKMIYDGCSAEAIERQKEKIYIFYNDLSSLREQLKYWQEQEEQQRRQHEELTRKVEEKIKKALEEKRKKEAVQKEAEANAQKQMEKEQQKKAENKAKRAQEIEKFNERQRQDREERQNKMENAYKSSYNKQMQKSESVNMKNHDYIDRNADDIVRISGIVSKNTSIAETSGFRSVHKTSDTTMTSGNKTIQNPSDIFSKVIEAQQNPPKQKEPIPEEYNPFGHEY